ncbi:Hypothetical protein FKW44_019361 [Caligus rogercresseyi]|uniref:Uncharacterized protein n=1 Tax=Caligus rogercresseyi TaxID=217165 RepID=A0A7T8GVQ1_CALRO|nr:Hypothetical protein FKW44_019361 [Caligus rogercresseyi]
MGLPSYNVNDKNQSYIKIYMRTGVRVKTSTFDFTTPNMIAEIGGTTGLLLGISLIQTCISLKNFVLSKMKKI